MDNQKLYAPHEIFIIIQQSTTATDMTDLIDFMFLNAVDFIKKYGGTTYNAIAFAIQEKLRKLLPIAA